MGFLLQRPLKQIGHKYRKLLREMSQKFYQRIYQRIIEGKLFFGILEGVALLCFGLALFGRPDGLSQPPPFEENINSRIRLSFSPKVAPSAERESYRGKDQARVESLTQNRSRQKQALERYLAQIKQQIESKKHYPRREKLRGNEGIVQLRFIIDRNGRLLSNHLALPSPYKGLNRSALQSVQDAAPFPPFPEEMENQNLTLEFRLDFRIE